MNYNLDEDFDEQEEIDDIDEDSDAKSGICSECNGSGEGMHDGTICHYCHGRGEVQLGE